MEDFSDTRIQVRRGTASEWSAKNPILGDGEPGYDLTNKIFKIGDGTTRWASLSGVSGASDSLTQEDLDQAISNLINSAPETLDTLNEIAAAINNNASFFETVAYSGGDISQFNNDAGYLQSEANDLTSSVTWTNVPDANITESSVVQHSGALRLTESQIVDLGSYIASGENVSLLVNDSDYIASNTNIATGSDKVTNIVSLSQAEYDAITPSTGVLYFIDDAPAPATSGDNISQFTNDAGYLTAETNDLTSTVTWANVPDANITESSVVQHSGSLRLTESQIVDLGNYLASGDNVSKLSNDAGYIISDNSVASGSDLVTNVISLTQEEYDLITPESGIVYLISGGSTAITSETNDLTSAVTWANVPDANITESSVIQHSGALRLTESQIVDLGDYVASGDNVSLLVNDSNYVASGDNISLLTNDSLYVASDVTGITGASGVSNIVQISQTDYDALGTYDQNTIYFIV